MRRGMVPTWSARSARSGDFLALDRDMPELESRRSDRRHDRRRLWRGAGGTYNTRALVPEVLVRGKEWAVVRPRLEVDAIDRARSRAALAVRDVPNYCGWALLLAGRPSC